MCTYVCVCVFVCMCVNLLYVYSFSFFSCTYIYLRILGKLWPRRKREWIYVYVCIYVFEHICIYIFFFLYLYIPEDPREVVADKWDLNYVGLDGNVICIYTVCIHTYIHVCCI